MSGESPNVIIYDVSGQEMSVSNGLAIPTATSALLFAGSDGTNAHYILMDGSGRTIVAGAGTAGTPTAGVLTIQGISGGTVVPVSGTVTANQGTANSLANAWTTELTDGTHGPVAVKAASTAAVATDPSLVVSISPNNTVTVVGDAASGSALAGNPVLIAGSDGTDARNLSTNTSGNLLVAQAAVTGVALADAWTTKITDATNGPVAVKPASTAAVATDPALVVAISPNNALSLSAADITNTGALGALNATVSVTHPGLGSVGFQLAAGTLIGTIIPEVSFDGGTTWNATFFDIPNTGNIVTSFVFGSSNTATAATIAGVGGAGQTRVRVSAYTSGTANITVRASDISDPSLLNSGAAGAALPPIIGQVGGSVTTSSPTYTTGTLNALSLTTAGAIRIDGSAVTQPVSLSGTVTVVGDAASGSAVAGNPVLIAGSDGTDARTISTDASGHAIVLGAQTAETTAAWTSATSANATATLTVTGYGTIAVTLNQGTTITGGVLTFEVSDTAAGTNWYPIGVISSYSSIPTSTYTLVASTNIAFQMNISAFIQFRVRLSTVISGTGTVNVGIAANYTSAPIENQQFTLITDGTHGPAAVKAASTAAVATDPALVVAISPNNTISLAAAADATATGALGALNATVQITTAGYSSTGMQLAAGTLIGTIIPEASFDGGTTWNATYFDSVTTGNIITSFVFGSSNTATAATIIGTGGAGLMRVRVSAYTSGTANITLRASQISDPSSLSEGVPGQALPPVATLKGLSDGTDIRAVLGDTSGRTIVIGAAATGAAVAGNPVLVAGSDGTDARTLLTNTSGNLLNIPFDNFGNAAGVKNKTQTPSTLGVTPVSGLDNGLINRIIRVGDDGVQRTTSETIIWYDALEGSTVNTFWTQSVTTQTIAQATGILTLNNSGITTLSTDSIITSKRQFAKLPRVGLHARIKANISANVATNHSLVEFGFGAPSGVTAIISNGCFFRVTAAGNLVVVTSYNGTETVSATQLAQGSITTTTYYKFDIFIDDQFAHFVVVDANEIPVVDFQQQIPVGQAALWAVSHSPVFARTYVDTTGGGTAVKLNIGAFDVQMLDALSNKGWEFQMASVMRQASINPTSYAQTGSSMTAAPAGGSPSNTTSLYTVLGGEYIFTILTGSENPLSVFAFTIPAPYTFYLHSLFFSAPFVTTVFSTTNIPVFEWLIVANCASVDINTGGGQLMPVGVTYVATSATQAVGTQLTNAGSNSWSPHVPIVCLPGTVLHIGYKALNNSGTTTGAIRGSVVVDGFFE